MPEPPHTEEGWYVLHDFRAVNWPAYRAAPDAKRRRAVEEGIEYLREHDDPEEGATAVFSVLGHKADLLVLHMRPSTAELDSLERRFEQTALADYTSSVSSYLSVTEASGYSERAREHFRAREAGEADTDSGIGGYIDSRIRPELPDAEHVCFYPMDKRRGPEHNWYDLPFEERAELMEAHGEIGRQYAGKVKQIISGSMGLDDHEWGVTLFADDPTDIKRLLNEMRFDPSSSRYAEFGRFYFGRRFPPADLDAYLAGEPVPTGRADGEATAESEADAGDGELAAELARLGVDVDAPEGAWGVVVRSTEPVGTVAEAVDGLRGNFEHYDSHVRTETIADDDASAVVSAWANEGAADTARGFLEDLPGVEASMAGPLAGGDDPDGRTVDPDSAPEADAGGGGASGDYPHGSTDPDSDAPAGGEGMREELAELGVYGGQPHGEDVYAIVVYSEADAEPLAEEVDSLADGFDRYDTHRGTDVYEHSDDPEGGLRAVVSVWDTEDAADTAGDYLADLPDVVGRAGQGPITDDGESGFGTMGMFYTVKPEHREAFVERFGAVGDLLAGMDGHGRTDLMVNVEDANDMFIASRWRSKEDAMAFFRSEEFRETVQWGRDVLADRPRHVFLA
jgi:chlorite dismutase